MKARHLLGLGFVSVLAAAVAACSSDSDGGARAGAGGANGGATASGGVASSNAGGAGRISGGAGAAAAGASGSSVTGGAPGNGGAAAAGSPGASGTAGNSGSGGSGGSSPPIGAGGESQGGEGGASDEGSTVFPCLAKGVEKLAVKIGGQPSLALATPSSLTCLSRFFAASADDQAELTLDWGVDQNQITLVLRQYDVVPGQLGTFQPFAVLIADGADAWLGVAGKCHVKITTSQKLGEMPLTDTVSNQIYQVGGSMTCDAGWALGNDSATLDQFEFMTRVTFTAP